MSQRLVLLAVGLALLVAACGSTDAELPPVGDDVPPPPPAGACLEGEPDCQDTLDPGVVPTDLPDPNVDPADVAVVLTVDEVVAQQPTGTVTVTGFYLVSDDVARLCSALAESFPPQCGGQGITVAGPVAVATQDAQGVTWSDQPAFVIGELIDGVLVATDG